MNDVLRALSISAGILLPVLVLIVIIAMVAVKRGEAALTAESHHASVETLEVKETAAPAAAAKSAKPAGPVVEEVSVSQILIYGVGLFVVTILALLGLSLIAHMG